MRTKSIRSKPKLFLFGAGLLALSLALTQSFAGPTEFEDAECLTWNSCSQCVVGFGADLDPPQVGCYAAVGSIGTGSASHCRANSSTSGEICIYESDDDPGSMNCFLAVVYLCTIGSPECICECAGDADVTGVTVSDTDLCDNL